MKEVLGHEGQALVKWLMALMWECPVVSHFSFSALCFRVAQHEDLTRCWHLDVGLPRFQNHVDFYKQQQKVGQDTWH